MGLDLVEFVMRVEEEFGVEISNEEAAQATTVGKLHDLVLSKLKVEKSTDGCLTMAAFHRTRRAMIAVLPIPKRQIRPSTLLDSVIPEEGRADVWKAIRTACSLEMPDLETAWVIHGNRYQSGAATVGELARKVLVLNYRAMSREVNGWGANDLWNLMRTLVVEQFGVKPEDVTREARFVEDLKID